MSDPRDIDEDAILRGLSAEELDLLESELQEMDPEVRNPLSRIRRTTCLDLMLDEQARALQVYKHEASHSVTEFCSNSHTLHLFNASDIQHLKHMLKLEIKSTKPTGHRPFF